MEASQAQAAPQSRPVMAQVADFISLTKPRLSGLVMFTAFGGMWLARTPLSWLTWLSALVGTALTVGAANTFNCVIERDSDRFMARTAVRPLPQRRMEPAHALAFGLVLMALAVPTLAFGVNVLTAVLGLLALGSYVLLYTPMKSRSHWAMIVGAFPGALPPLMGWTAATGRLEFGGLALFGILFFWQLPHFIAIALFRKAEYQAAGLTSLPLEKGDAVARGWALAYSLALVVASLAPYWGHVSSWLYLVVAIVLDVGFVGVALKGLRAGDARWARQLFFMSLVYLTGLFVALGLDASLLR